jgi:hypothetical protein
MDLDRSPGSEHRIDPNDPILPTIWPFKVDSITYVGEDKMQEWEEAMREKVGLSKLPAQPGGDHLRAQFYKPGCATTSGSGYGWDDCDYWGPGC